MSDKRVLRNFVDGESVDAVDGRTTDLVEPDDRRGVRLRARCPAPRTSTAPTAAAAAGFEYAGATPRRRSARRRCSKIADMLEAHADELVALESENTGKPIAVTMAEEIPPMIDQIRFFAGAARLLEGRSAGEYMEGFTSMIRREPIGVVGQVTPWNYPMMMAVWKYAPAIAAGNAVVLKPSDTTPVSTVRMAELIAEADALPAGVFNVVCGDREHRRRADRARDPRRCCPSPARSAPAWPSPRRGRRTSSASTSSSAARRPVVIFDDADLEAAAEWLAVAGYFNAGQDCTAATRMLVAPGVYDDFVVALSEQARAHGHHVRGRSHRRGRARPPGQQRAPDGARPRVPRPRPGARRGRRRRQASRRPRLSSSSPPSSPTCSRTTR